MLSIWSYSQHKECNVSTLVIDHLCLILLFNFSVSRMEEKESELKKEYNKLHERYTEVNISWCIQVGGDIARQNWVRPPPIRAGEIDELPCASAAELLVAIAGPIIYLRLGKIPTHSEAISWHDWNIVNFYNSTTTTKTTLKCLSIGTPKTINFHLFQMEN